MRNSICYLFLIAVIFSCQTKTDLPASIDVLGHWEFKNVKDSIWQPANVPGNVHSDLIKNKIIADPFIGSNELKVQWVSENDWEYKTEFSLDEETFRKKNIELKFEGLDTYTSVYLNDSLILSTKNAFREYSSMVQSYIKVKNTLRIVFDAPSNFETLQKSKLTYTLPEGNRIFTRKAQFQYGWDWGPKLNTIGIWKPVKLTAWNDLKISDIYIQQLKIDDSLATLAANIELQTDIQDNVNVDIIVNEKKIATHSISLEIDKRNYMIPFGITDPKLWWPHNLGEPYLYDLKFIVRHNETILDTLQLKKGLRTIRLITEKDSIGESFYFEVNGTPVYMKGANYIPQNSFQNKVSDSHYKILLDDAVDANMNMLRVWGGGIYENDIFYQLCDEKGILIWQDFMFACAMYPGDDNFLENVKMEAIDNLKRLRNYASIALWCGNNENSEGWHRWGWQDGKTEEQKTEIWSNYLRLFDTILPEVVHDLTNIPYWESSPKYGRGNPKYEFEGDAHDWWVWHDAYPFEQFVDHVPRFMSEFGFQSFPGEDVINYINQSDSLDISSQSFSAHQKHVRGFQLIDEYMGRDFPVPTDPSDYVYISQLLQAYGIVKGIEAHRRAKPVNMGTLYWQLNDCWPAISWSSIDFFGQWKALHYKAKRAFENLLISTKEKDDAVDIYIINDAFESTTGELEISLMNFDGQIIKTMKSSFTSLGQSSELAFKLSLGGLEFDRFGSILKISFDNSEYVHYFSKPKDLKLGQGEISQQITKIDSGFKIELSSKTFQKDVFLYCDERGHFSDNYFDLLPNQKKTVIFKTKSQEIVGFATKTFNNFIR